MPAPWYQHEELGYNYRMSNIVAGTGRRRDETNPIMHSFHKHYCRAMVRDNRQDMSLAEISTAFSFVGIDHIPLKGRVVKHYYLLPDIRRGGDIDILIKPFYIEKADKVHVLFGL